MICEINSMGTESVVGGSAGETSARPSVKVNLQQVFTPVRAPRQPSIRNGKYAGRAGISQPRARFVSQVLTPVDSASDASRGLPVDPTVDFQSVRCCAFLPRFCRAYPKLDTAGSELISNRISSGSAPQNPMPEAGGQRTTRAATNAISTPAPRIPHCADYAGRCSSSAGFFF